MCFVIAGIIAVMVLLVWGFSTGGGALFFSLLLSGAIVLVFYLVAREPESGGAAGESGNVFSSGRAADLTGLSRPSFERPGPPPSLEKAVAECGSAYNLMALLARLSPDSRPFLKEQAAGFKNRKARLSMISDCIGNTSSGTGLKACVRDLEELIGLPGKEAGALKKAADDLEKNGGRLNALYNDAVAAAGRNELDAAYKNLLLLGDFKDSKTRLQKLRPRLLARGQTVLLGRYPQSAGGAEAPIEWIVLKKDGCRALLISRFVIDCMPFNESREKTDWKRCTLRRRLNDTFFNTAFSEAEKELVLSSRIENPENPLYLTPGGGETTDRVFLLSVPEAEIYFGGSNARLTSYTPYALSRCDPNDHVGGRGYWWLRTPGNFPVNNTFVAGEASRLVLVATGEVLGSYSEGECVLIGFTVDHRGVGVRPAVWIEV